MSIEFDTVLQDFIRRHNLAVEELTEQQLAEAMRQIIRSGDLMRYVTLRANGGIAQVVVYEPFAREEQLKNRIRNLEDFLRQQNIPIPPPC